MHTITTPGPLRRRLGSPMSQSRPPGLGLGSGIFAALGRLVEVVLTWQDRAAQRTALARMDERMLKDIGITRSEALEEARRPFWQA